MKPSIEKMTWQAWKDKAMVAMLLDQLIEDQSKYVPVVQDVYEDRVKIHNDAEVCLGVNWDVFALYPFHCYILNNKGKMFNRYPDTNYAGWFWEEYSCLFSAFNEILRYKEREHNKSRT